MIQSLLWLCALCVSFVTGCIHDGIDAALTVDSKIVSVDARANYVSYTVTANTDWTIASNEDWCTPNVEGGIGTTTIYLSIEANDSSIKREAILSLVCGGKTTTVTIMQGALAAEMAVAPGEIEIDYSAQDVQIAVMSNVSWIVSTDGADLISSYTPSGSDNGIITIQCLENTTYTTRTGTIIVSNSDKTLVEQVTITQLAAGLPTLALSQEALSFDNLASTQSVALSSNIDSGDITVSSDFSWCTPSVNATTGNIDVDVAQNSTSLSRSAIVMVSGIVDGESVSAQIVVSQAGVGYPVLYLVNSSLDVAQAGQSNIIIRYASENVTDVTISSYDSFITVNADDTITLSENTSKESLVGTIALMATNASGNESYYYVTVTQAGVGTPDIQTTPSSITLSAYAGSASFYSVVSNPSVKFSDATSSASWLNNFVKSGGSSDDNLAFTYSYDANASSAARTGYISLEYTVGDQNVFKTIQVTQNGLGAPAISTLESVYLLTDQESHTQSLWLSDGDDTGVEYTIYVTSNDSDVVGSSVGWLSASVDSSAKTLTLTSTINTASESRSGVVTLIATRDNAQTIVNIDVTQAGHLSAGISGLDQEIYVDSRGYTTSVPYYFSALNDSEVTVVNVSNDTMVTSPVKDAILNEKMDLTVAAYDGSLGAFRECIITLSANNGNSVVEYYDILVRQYEPDAAIADVPELLELEYDNIVANTVQLDLYNDATIKDASADVTVVLADGTKLVGTNTPASGTITSTAFAAASGDTSWLTVGVTPAGLITYTALKYDGVDGDTRTATISVTVTNTNYNTATYFINVVQYAPRATTITAASEVSVLAPITSATVKYTTTGDGDITVTPSEEADWITAVSPTPSATAVAGSASFTFTLNANPYSVSRSAVVTLTAKGDDNTTVATTVTITQAGTGDAMIELPSDIMVGYELATANSDNGGSITPGLSESTTVTSVSDDADWLSASENSSTANQIDYSVTTAYDGADGDERYATITVVSENSTTGQESTNYITVTQTAPMATSITGPTNQTVAALYSDATGFNSTENIAATINFVVNGDNNSTAGAIDWAKADIDVAVDVDWILDSSKAAISGSVDATAIDAAGTNGSVDLYFKPNTAAASREAQIVITATGDHAESATIYVTVTQLGLDAPTATFSSGDYISANYAAMAAATINVDLGDGDTIVSVTDTDTSNAWLTTNWTSGDEDFTYELKEYDGSAGATRTATIEVVVQNEGKDTEVTYYITVVQNAPKVMTVSASPIYNYNAVVESTTGTAEDFTIALSLLGDLTGTDTAATYTASIATDDNGTWATVDHTSAASGNLTLSLNDNPYSEERTAIITITTDNGAYYQPTVSYIEIVQAGTGDELIDVQGTLLLGYAEIAEAAKVTVAPTLSEDTTISVSDDADWLTTADTATTNNETFTYTASANKTAEPRTAVITIVATNSENGHTGNAYIYVTQAAPEAPSIVAPAIVTVDAYGATTSDEATKTFYYTYDGDGTVSASNITPPSGSIFASATTSTVGEVALVVIPNLSAESRTETITIELTSTVSDEKAYAYVEVVQAGVGSPVIDFASDLVQYDYKDTTSGSMSYTLSDGAEVTAASASTLATWINVTLGTGSPLAYTVDAYDGAAGSTRTGTIDVTVENDSNSLVYSLTIVQTAPLSPSITIQGSATIGQADASTVDVDYTLTGDTATALSLATPSITYADASGWLTATAAGGKLTLEASAENTATTSRSATVKLTTVDHATATAAVEYITVTQLGLDSPKATFTSMAYDVDYKGATYADAISSMSSDAKLVSVTSSNPSMIADPSITAGTDTDFDFTVKENTTAETRTAYLTVVVDNYDSSNAQVNDEVTYVITVTQTGAAPLTLDVIEAISVDAAATSATLYYTSNGDVASAATTFSDGVAVSAGTDASGTISVSFVANTSSASRTAVVAVTATSTTNTDTTTEYVTITQRGTGSPLLTVGTTLSVDPAGETTDTTIGSTVASNVTLDVVSNATWLTITDSAALVYTATTYDGTDGDTRYATITVTATDSSTGAVEVTNITVSQNAPAKTTITATSSVTAAAAAGDVTATYTTTGSNVSVTPTYDGTIVTGVSTDPATGEVTITVAENTSPDARSATVTLTADGDHADNAVAYISVNQVGAGTPTVTFAEDVVTYNAGVQTGVSVTPTLSAGAEITNVTAAAGWITIDNKTTTDFTYDLAAYTGTEGASRSGTITVEVTSGTTTATYNLTIVQVQPILLDITYDSASLPNLSGLGGKETLTYSSTNCTPSNITITSTYTAGLVDYHGRRKRQSDTHSNDELNIEYA